MKGAEHTEVDSPGVRCTLARMSKSAIAIGAWLVLGAIVVGALAPPDGEPGLNYDEAFLAQQARDFLEPERSTVHPPSERSTWLLGRRFPLRNAAYLGALKPQLLIPAFAIFGPDPHTLRMATLGTALLSLLFTMLWARRVFGLAPALLGGALVAFDPSFVFFGSCEWGPYTALLLCRCLGLYLLTAGWQDERGSLVVAGALAMGLGVYARADFVLIGVAAAVGLLACRGPQLWREARGRPRTVVFAGIALVVGALPMLLSVIDLLTVASGISERGDLAYRARVLWSTLDGSHYYRVIAMGGLFEELFEDPAPWGLFGLALAAALVATGVRLAKDGPAEGPTRAALVFLGVTVACLGLSMLALPGAVRAHHMLNLMPFTHLLVAVVMVAIASTRIARVTVSIAALAILASELRVVAETRSLIAETGGRGRYSNALDTFAAELAAAPEQAVVSLDWGFHETFQFLTSENPLSEPIWQIPRLLASGRAWGHVGDARHHYVVFAPRYELFGFGPAFLDLARAQPAERVEIREHRDRQGEHAFTSVRFTVPHRLIYDGRFRLEAAR